jgi:hypothetical protein
MAAPKCQGLHSRSGALQGGTETRRAAQPKQKPAVPQGAACFASRCPIKSRMRRRGSNEQQ